MVAQPVHVMVVEDDARVRTVIQAVLANAGYQVTTAENGQQALDQVREAAPDLLLLDLMMPGMNGLELRERLPREIAVVIMSAMQFTWAGELSRIAVDYLAKPFGPDRLLEVVGRVAATCRSDEGPSSMRPCA